MLKQIIQKIKENWQKAKCDHKRVLETEYVRTFTIGKVTGVIPLFICINCKKKIHKTIN